MVRYSTELVWPCATPTAPAQVAPLDAQRALVDSLSRWHMRWFLALAKRQNYCVKSYRDTPTGWLETNGAQPQTLVRLVLSPQVVFSGARQPDAYQIMGIHAAARAQCELSNGVEMVVCHPGHRLDRVPEGVPLQGWLWRLVRHLLFGRRHRPMAPL